MKRNYIAVIGLVLVLISSVTLVIGSEDAGQTNFEITEINGGIGGVTAVITNTGEHTAEFFTISLFVDGGMKGNIDIQQVCSGCGDCSTMIQIGESKPESTREAGFIFGFGTIDILVTVSADNADLVSKATSGFVIGPFIIVQAI